MQLNVLNMVLSEWTSNLFCHLLVADSIFNETFLIFQVLVLKCHFEKIFYLAAAVRALIQVPILLGSSIFRYVTFNIWSLCVKDNHTKELDLIWTQIRRKGPFQMTWKLKNMWFSSFFWLKTQNFSDSSLEFYLIRLFLDCLCYGDESSLKMLWLWA